MRDPARIQRVLNKMSVIWNAYPDFRFGQMYICVGQPETETNAFYIEDDDFEKYLDKYIKYHNLDSGWKS